MIDTVQKVAGPPSTGLARETLTLLVSGVEQEVEVVRQERHNGGCQAYWCCPRCEALRCDLYVVDGMLACRVCHRLDYRSRHVLNRAVTWAAKLRRRLGAAPGLMGKLPPRPKHHMQAARYDRLARQLAKQEAILAELLSATVRALERRKGQSHGSK